MHGDWREGRTGNAAAVRWIRRRVSGIALAAPLALVLAGCDPTALPPGDALAFTNARVIDGNGGPVLDDITIVIQGGRIAQLGPSSAIAIPLNARRMDLTGRVVTPGFVDMHYHVTTGAMRYRRDAAGRLDSTYDRRLAERLLRIALARGITTIRDPGASPVDVAVALREAVDSGSVVGPRIFTAGPIIADPGLGDSAHPRRGRGRRTRRAWISSSSTPASGPRHSRRPWTRPTGTSSG